MSKVTIKYFPLLDLPQEITTNHILVYFCLKEFKRLRFVCKTFNFLVQKIWTPYFSKYFKFNRKIKDINTGFKEYSSIQFYGLSTYLKDDVSLLMIKNYDCFKKLKNLFISVNRDDVSNIGWSFLPSTLTDLALSFNGYRSEDIKCLPSNLKKLELRVDLVTDEMLKVLPPNLIELRIENSHNITNQGLKFLPSSLIKLDLLFSDKNCMLTNSDMQYIPSTIKTLCFNHNKNITDEILRYIPSTLTELHIYNCYQLKDEGFKYISSTLLKLTLHGGTGVTTKLLELIPSTLRELNISFCHPISYATRLPNPFPLTLKIINNF
jgi:hypothetical protein